MSGRRNGGGRGSAFSRASVARAFLVGHVYANHNHCAAVRDAVASVLSALDGGEDWGLDVGAGGKRLHPRLWAMDLDPASRERESNAGAASGALACVASAEALPFASGAMAVVVSQEVLEHVADPWRAVAEAVRVLKPGGRLYLQAPFVIGYHGCPHDYWRFTGEGLRRLVESAGLVVERLETSVGAGSGFYRVAVEFWATLAAVLWARLYLPVKALAAVLLRPLCAADRITARSPASHRIPGGHFVIAVKPSCAS